VVDAKVKVVGAKAIRNRLNRQKLGSLTKAMHERISKVWQEAGDAFIREAIRQVLVETGMSAASFFPLSRAIKLASSQRFVTSHISSNPKIPPKKGIATFPSGKRVGGTQSIATGKRFGKAAFRFNLGSADRPVFRFQFLTLVFQLAFHEPTQKALDLGFDAFQDVVNRRVLIIFRATLREFLTPRRRAARILGI